MSSWFPIEAEEELRLIQSCSSCDRAAAEKLLNAHMPMLLKICGRLHAPAGFHEDLIQSGCLGFIKALQHFDLQAGNRFMTYAVPWILGEMRRSLKQACSSDKPVSLDAIIEKRNETTVSRQLMSTKGIDADALDLHCAIEQLNEAERRLIIIRFFCGKTQCETAKLLGKSQSQVSKLEQKTLIKLQNMLT